MGANSTQAVGIMVFLLAFTALALGLATARVIYYVLTLALLGVSIAIFLRCKPLEHAEN